MNKRILTAALATASVVLCAAVGSYAAPLDHIVPEGAPEPVALTEEQYKQFKFEWTDAAGVKHTSDVTERATDPNHIVALIKEVYTNPQIPGFVYDRAYDLMVDETNAGTYDWTSVLTEPDAAGFSRNITARVPYKRCYLPPFNMDKDLEVETPVEGCTALLVELKDSYTNHPGVLQNSLEYVEAVTLISKQLYVSKDVDNSRNPGFLFNIEANLNKFFIVTKGKNRYDNYNYDKDTGESVGVPLFYLMYEEYSPNNTGAFFDAYKHMNAGAQFPVDHNCSATIGQGHDIVLDSYKENTDEYRHYPINIMFYLPDYRFYGDSRFRNGYSDASQDPVGPTQSHTKMTHYTFYPYKDSHPHSESFRPFVYFNQIRAEINGPQKKADEDGSKVWVPLKWKSSYKSITRSNAPERFTIYRVVNGIAEKNPIPLDQIKIEQEGVLPYTDATDGKQSVTCATDSVVRISILEPVGDNSRSVQYMVRGRRLGATHFSFVESNMVSDYIHGTSKSETLRIAIDGELKSSFNLAEGRNDYENIISINNEVPREDAEIKFNYLRYGHIKVPVGAEGGSVFELRRYTGFDRTDFVKVAELEITGKSREGDLHVFSYKITYTDGVTPAATGKFAAAHSDNADVQTTTPVLPYGDAKALAVFTDRFSADVTGNAHPSLYEYQIQYMADQVVNDELESPADHIALSNIISVPVYKRDLILGFRPYYAADVEADSDYAHLLPQNDRMTTIEVANNVSARSYDVMCREHNHVVASAERDPNGAYYLQLRNAAGQLVLDHEPTEPAYEGKLEFTLPSEAFSDLSHHLTLVIRDVKGNSYGTDTRTIVDIPTLEMEPVSAFYTINDNPANLYLETKADWSLAAPEGWTVEAIRFWAHHTTETVINPAPADFSNIANAGWLSGSEPTLALDNASLGTEGSRKYGITVSKDGLTNYNVSHGMRAYVRIPDTYVADANHTAGTPAYFVVDASGSSTATGDNVQTGIDGIEAAPEAEAEYYTLQGARISKADLTPGVYIERRGGKARKIMVK